MRTQMGDQLAMERMRRQEKNVSLGSPYECVRDQTYIKQYNIQSVMMMLRKWQPVSRTDISRMTGMSPTSITRIITALINRGLVHETIGNQHGGRGRKATNLQIDENRMYALGIHLERKTIRMSVSNLAGEVMHRSEALVECECTPEQMAAEARAQYGRISEEISAYADRICAASVSMPGVVDTWDGVVRRSDQLGWENEDVGQVFSEAFGLPVSVENDVKAALIGEKAQMDIPDIVDAAYLMVGSGVGLAMTSGGILMRGARSAAGEIARIPAGYGEDNHLSNYLTEANLIRRAQRFAPSVGSVDAILWAKEQGQEWAQEIMRDYEMYLQVVLSMIIGIADPTKIILGGSLIRKTRSHLGGILQDERICLGGPYEEACTLGAGMIAMRRAVTDMILNSIDKGEMDL